MAFEYQYRKQEEYPVEYLIFKTQPEDVEAFLEADHQIWTMREATMEGLDQIPFLSKEVWLNKNKPGEIHCVFVWESLEHWKQVGKKEFQEQLMAEFDQYFGKPYEFVWAQHESENFGVYRYSRFERI